jgi:hypothetical protein
MLSPWRPTGSALDAVPKEETGRGTGAAVPVSLCDYRLSGRHRWPWTRPSRLPGQLSLPEPPEAGQLLSMVGNLVLMAVGFLDPTARLSLI